jgi:hypothetical protein
MRLTLRISLVALALQPVVAWEASAKPVRWSGNGHLYEVRVAPEPEGISWVQALLRADALGCGWYLVTITSKAENDFVFKLAARYPQVFDAEDGHGPWIGGFQANRFDEPAGNWRRRQGVWQGHRVAAASARASIAGPSSLPGLARAQPLKASRIWSSVTSLPPQAMGLIAPALTRARSRSPAPVM